MIKRILILALTALFTTFAGFSQTLLWKVSGKNIKSPSYLYGTIHIQDERVFAFDNTMPDALNSCDAFAMEILLDEVNTAGLSQSMMMPKGQYLSDYLSKADFALLDSLCKAKLGTSAMFMNTMKPFFIGSAIQQADMPKDMETALDLHLLKKARDGGKHCYGVEEYMDQINAIDAIKMKDQIKMLEDILHDTTKAGEKDFNDLLQAYLSFDYDKMMVLMQDTTMPKNFEKVLINDRNKTMAKQFVNISKQHTLFCAVGAAHLAGEKGVLALLRKKGYTVEPVLFQWKK